MSTADNDAHGAAGDADQPQYVARGGVATPSQLRAGTRLTANGYGFSVQTAPGVPVDELARGGRFPNRRISITTVQELRAAGVTVNFPTPGAGAHHGTVVVPSAAAWHLRGNQQLVYAETQSISCTIKFEEGRLRDQDLCGF
jgi:hypothetical protein